MDSTFHGSLDSAGILKIDSSGSRRWILVTNYLLLHIGMKVYMNQYVPLCETGTVVLLLFLFYRRCHMILGFLVSYVPVHKVAWYFGSDDPVKHILRGLFLDLQIILKHAYFCILQHIVGCVQLFKNKVMTVTVIYLGYKLIFKQWKGISL